MKKKILFGLGTLAFTVMLSLNINLAKTNNKYNTSLNNLFSVAKAEAEDQDPWYFPLCIQWCNWQLFSYCQLRVYDDWVICQQMVWP